MGLFNSLHNLGYKSQVVGICTTLCMELWQRYKIT